jgi:ribosomal-protein-alanine N-acetyltransferase
MNKIILRFLCQKDLRDIFDLLQNPRVMKYIGPKRPLTDDEVRGWFDTEMNSPSRFVIALSHSDEILGLCGVKDLNGVLDFGYFLREAFWNQGYATEACHQALDNHASRSVAKKLHWSILSDVQKDNEAGHLYAVNL